MNPLKFMFLPLMPSPGQVARRQLDEAQREFLHAAARREEAAAQEAMLDQRVRRLREATQVDAEEAA